MKGRRAGATREARAGTRPPPDVCGHSGCRPADMRDSDAGTAATTRVIIESKDGEEHWSTIGVSENVVEASWIALCDSIEYKLAKSIDYKDKANR